jgi:N-terminal C2 in EEIG1 and EHBP1 proteins
MLDECHVHFEIVQDYAEGQKGGRVLLGNVKLNLSEYVDREGELRRHPDGEELGEEDGEGITRRYLMQESKINSTLKVGIHMKQVEGEKDFIVPPLKTATAFGGIAGIVATETGDPKAIGDRGSSGGDIAPLTKKTRELTESQDMYRRTLAATWACRSGELPPDKLVEDLFAGGDGGSMRPLEAIHRWRSANGAAGRMDGDDTSSTSDAESRRTPRAAFLSPDVAEDAFRNSHGGGNGNGNGNGKQEQTGHRRHGTRSGHGSGSSNGGSGDTVISGRGSIEQQMSQSMRGPGNRHRDHKEYNEVTEFDIRQDLRSWIVTDRGVDGALGGPKDRHGSARINQALLYLQGM